MMEPVAWTRKSRKTGSVKLCDFPMVDSPFNHKNWEEEPLVRLSDAEARIAELTKWRDEWKDMATELKGLVEEWQARAEAAEALLKEAFLRGFMSSAEGYNGEYPFDLDEDCLNSQKWVEMRDRFLSALKEKPRP